MNTEVKRSELLHALAAADGIARTNSTMPLLECVLIEASNMGTLTIAATDAAMAIRATLASKNRKAGAVAMNAKLLREVIKGAPDDLVSLTQLDNHFVEIKSGKAKYKLAAIAGRDFPKVPELARADVSVKLDADDVKRLIDRTLFATSDDLSRAALRGALLEVHTGVASLTATDGHRLARATCACDASVTIKGSIIPQEALSKIKSIAHGEVHILVEKSRLFVQTAGLTMSTPLLDFDFPPYDQVIPKSCKVSLVVDRAALVASIERAKITISESRGMNITGIDGGLELSSRHPDVGDISDEIAVDGKTKDVTSCAAPKYFLEPLARFTDDKVKLEFLNELDPIVLKSTTEPSNYVAVIMPMRRY